MSSSSIMLMRFLGGDLIELASEILRPVASRATFPASLVAIQYST
jgi:hypothetical protein